MCISAREAIQSVLLVRATAVGELQHSVIPGRTCWLCAPGDVAAIGAALQALVENPERAARMGAAGLERLLARFGDAAFRQSGDAVLARTEALIVITRR